ncbi:MAG TPA: type II secretion system F family protein [Chromatiales bacterium]|nr:type II secretion system F family protein [Chromatiales bacterium]
MPRFHYRGRSERGDAVHGVLEAASADAVAAQLMTGGTIPIEITEAREKRDLLQELRRRLGGGTPGLGDLILFSRQMHTLMRAGVPIIRALNGLAETYQNPVFKEALADVVENLESGRDLSSPLARHPRVFSSLFVSLVQVGENTGRLDEAFLQLAAYLEMEKETRDRIKAALRYPTIVIVAIAAALAIINLKVIPVFARVYSGFGAKLPWATQVLIATSNFTVAYWPYLLTILVLSYAGTRSYVHTDEGRYRWDKLKLRIPVVGSIVLRATLARFARAFSMASRSGVPLIQALTVVALAVDNEYVGDRVRSMRNGVERGESLTRTAATTGLFTPLVLQMLAVGEETGAVDEMLEQVGDFYEREVDYDLKNLSDAIEPILILGIGAIVLVLALGVFLPMWDLASAVQGH